MPKYVVTKNMGSALKNLRQIRRIRAVDIAKSIGKTGAYISKLEKGELNKVDEDDLYQIIFFMSKDENEFNEAIELLTKDTTMEFSDDEVQNKEWKMNLDQFYRKIPIQKEYLDIVKEKIHSLNITSSELAEYISANHDLHNDETIPKDKLENAPLNQWVFNNGNSFVVMSMDAKHIDDIINEKITTSNYAFLLCILISLLRLERIPRTEAYQRADAIFKELQIYTLQEKEEMMQAFDKERHLNDLIEQRNNEKHNPEDRKLINNLYDFTQHSFSFSQVFDVQYANTRLEILNSNFEIDPVLLMGFIGVDLSKLKDVDFQVKKQFVNAVKDLVNEYSIMHPQKEKQELI